MVAIALNQVIPYLASKGLVDDAKLTSVVQLKGGNLNYLYLIRTPQKSLVLKQALRNPHFKQDLILPPERNLIEKEAMVLFKKRTGSNSIPNIYHFDNENFATVMQAVPDKFVQLTCPLLKGEVNLSLAKKLGEFYAQLHNATYNDPEIKKQFAFMECFDKLKMALFHQELYNSTNDIKIKENVRQAMLKCHQNKIVLIHGDAQPKNILVNGNDFFVLDYEIATYSDPAHDLGNLAAHYLLSAIVNYPLRRKYYLAIEAIFDAYEEKTALKNLFPKIKINALSHFAPVMYGRVDGTANVPFIEGQTKEVARKIINTLASKEKLDLKMVFGIVDALGRDLYNNKPLTEKQITQGRMY